jgi:hypothetical protein
MKPLLAFWLCVLFSELSQWCIWKKGNPTKRWRDWLASGVPHFGANIGTVIITYFLWDAQLLDDVLAWCLSWVGLDSKLQWDKLLPYNVVVGAILGYAIDKLGDQVGRIVDLTFSSRLQRVTGVIGKFDAPGGEAKP